MTKKKSGINKGGFSWKRATGITGAKQSFSRKLGIPLTKSGRQRKFGRIVSGGGCVIPVLLSVAALAILLCMVTLVGCGSTTTTTSFQPITFTSNEYPPNQYSVANTTAFSVPVKSWVIDWSYTPSGDGVFAFYVFPNTGPDTNSYVASVYKPSTTSGSLSCNAGSGSYSITVTTLCTWSITVHQAT